MKTDRVESLYGDIALRARYGTRTNIFRAGHQPIFQFGAVTGSGTGAAEYILKGVFGGFTTVLEFTTWRAADRLFARYEGRDLRRYRLNMTEEQLVHAMQRIREAEDRFGTTTTSSSGTAPRTWSSCFAPPSTFRWANSRRLSSCRPTCSTRWLTPATEIAGRSRPGLHELAEQRDARARRGDSRRRLADALAHLLERAAKKDIDIVALQADLEQTDPRRRREAYDTLASWLPRLEGHAVASEHRLRNKLVDYLYLSTIIERYFVEQERFARWKTTSQTGRTKLELTARQQLAKRRELYKIQSLNERIRARNEITQRRFEALMADADVSQNLATTEAEIRERRARSSYSASLKALAEAISLMGDEWSGTRFVAKRQEVKVQELEAFNHKAIGPSGNWTMGQSVGLRVGDPFEASTGLVPELQLSIAFIHKELGEARLRGYGRTSSRGCST